MATMATAFFRLMLQITARLPAWLRMPVVGAGFLFLLLAARLVFSAARGELPSQQASLALVLPVVGLGSGFVTGLFVFALWRALRRYGRAGYCLTGAGALVAYMFTIAVLLGLASGKKTLPDSTGSWFLFVLYPFALGIVGGWVAYPGPVTANPLTDDRTT